ncbi:MAG: hypothetical protein ACT4PL_04600 [Phycisphaerales bacterium]
MTSGWLSLSPHVHRAIAGALAEAGVAELKIEGPGGPAETLRSRLTDLPGVLAGAPPGTVLTSISLGFRMVLAPSGWDYSTTDPDLASALLAIDDGRDGAVRY